MDARSFTGTGADWRKTRHEVTKEITISGGTYLFGTWSSEDDDRRRVELKFKLDDRSYSLILTLDEARKVSKQLDQALVDVRAI